MLLYFAAVFVFGVAGGQNPTIRLLGQREARLPGFSNLYLHENTTDGTERYSLILSTFSSIPFTRDDTLFFHHIGKYLDDFANAPLTVVNDRFMWPREPSQTPGDVFGFEGITQPCGFLIPGKTRGTINIVDFRDYDNPIVYDIVEDPVNWFYHRVLWKDCNGDGLKDALTLRARVDLLTGISYTEMLWFEHPQSEDVFDGAWETHILNQDIVGTFMSETTVVRDGQVFDLIVGVGYFTNRLVIFWTNDPDGQWDDPSEIGSRVIDVGGKFFDVQFADANNDGNPDILVPVNSEMNGTLWAYEIPEDFRYGEYKRHLIADDFDARSGTDGGGSPGQGFPFYPHVSITGKPWIFISGDDEGTAYYLIPNSQDPDDWSYEKVRFFDQGVGNIFGKLSAADVNGDGYTEIFVPAYQQELLYAFTFAPEEL